ncbi:MAG: hypothetical protein AMXMBFR83_08240 [Phycisphaerae bacterium]
MTTRRAGILFGLICGPALWPVGGCDGLALFTGPDSTGAVYVVRVEGLEPPPAAEPALYRVADTFPIDPLDVSAGRAAGFFVTLIAAGDPVRMRLLPGGDSAPIPLQDVPSVVHEDARGPAWSLPSDARQLLAIGRGVFWTTDERPAGGLERRYAVVLPADWSAPSVKLEIYAAATPEGDPLGADHVELARDFFYLAAIGDSVVWGNGLREPDKFTALVAGEIQRRTRRRVIRRVHAISAARILPQPGDVICPVSCNGEVQTATTPILTQVDLIESPGRVDLLLMDGCSNDVGITTILSHRTDDADLAERTERACGEAMRTLLGKARAAVPQAPIVVTGYYPIVSPETTPPELLVLLNARGERNDEPNADLVAQSAEQSRIFLRIAHAGIMRAVAAVAAESAGPPILFVDPGFSDSNALFAGQTLLWGLTADHVQPEAANRGLTLFPEDPLADVRAVGCFNNRLIDLVSCLYASVGHPNPAGARRYAQAILSALEGQGLIPPP